MNLTENGLNVLRIIRLCYDMKQNEFAFFFQCKTVHINEVEHGKKNLNQDRLKLGLSNLYFKYEDYLELVDYKEILETLDISNQKKYQLLLLRGLEQTKKSLEEASIDSIALKEKAIQYTKKQKEN